MEGFPWSRLLAKNTIGCNAAYELGLGVCKVLFFGDQKFYTHRKSAWIDKAGVHHSGMDTFGGWVITNCPVLERATDPWLKFIPRKARGLSHTQLGWNASSGAAAVHLALMFGARRVLLLGFDMALKDGRANYHENELDKPKAAVYNRFIQGFSYLARDLPGAYPGAEIINVTDGSRLDCFPKVSLIEHFGK